VPSFYQALRINILQTYGEFLLKGSSAFVIASMPTKGKDLYDAFLKLAIINFISIALFPFVSFLRLYELYAFWLRYASVINYVSICKL
jgi:hypothetical protein